MLLDSSTLVSAAGLIAAGLAARLWARCRTLCRERDELHGRWTQALDSLRAAGWAFWSWAGAPSGWRIEPEDSGVRGDDFIARLHPDDAQRLLDALAEAAPGSVCRVQARWDDGGGERAAEIVGRSTGRHHVGVLRDCTEDQKLIREAARNSQLIAQVHDAIVSTDLEGTIETWNAGARRLYGYEAHEAVGRHIELLYFDEDRGGVEEQMTAAVLASGAYEFVGRFRHRSGFPLSASVRLALLRDEHDAPVGVVSCSHDVTKQREREEAFQLRARVLESMREGVCLTDRRGVALHTNPACDKMFAPPGRGLVGRRLGHLLAADDRPPGYSAKGGPHEAAVPSVVQEALEDGDAWAGELEGQTWDGATIRVFAQVSSLVLSEGVFWVWVLQDVTQRQRDLAALEERESRFRMMADSTPAVVWMSDRRGRCIYVNAEWTKLTGLSAESSAGTGWLAAIDEEDRRSWAAGLRDRFERREPLECEVRLLRREDEPRWVLARGVPRYDGAGIFDGYIGSAVDITARKTAEEERRALLLRKERQRKIEALGVMAGGIAHDFNNLLVSMLGHADLALEDSEDPERVRESVRRFRQSAERAAELTNQVLAFSGRRNPRVELLRISDAFQETLPLIGASMKPEVRVEVETREEATVTADPGQLRQAIMNLLLNASDASGAQGGVIRVRTGTIAMSRERLAKAVGGDGLEPGRYVFLEVEDEGSGMSQEVIDSAFDPFFTTKFTGRGLGLAATLGVVRGHSGAIEVRSRPGAGTLFRVLLPASSEGIEKAGAAVTVDGKGSETILLVDDDHGVLDSTKRMLERWGYRVYTATGGRQALEELGEDSGELDLALVDVVMPDMTASETITALRRSRPGLPIILWSGCCDPESAADLLEHPTSGFLRKPFTSAQLAALVRGALSRSEAGIRAAAGDAG